MANKPEPLPPSVLVVVVEAWSMLSMEESNELTCVSQANDLSCFSWSLAGPAPPARRCDAVEVTELASSGLQPC